MRPKQPMQGCPRVLAIFILIALFIPPVCAQPEQTQNSLAPPVLSSGGSRARIVENGNASLRSAAPTNWQATSGPLPQAPRAESPNYYVDPNVVAASGTQPSASTDPLNRLAPSESVTALPNERTPLTPRSATEKGESKRSGGTLQMFLSVTSSLLIVIGLFFGVVWCYRKTSNAAIAGGLPKQVLNVLGRTPLAARQQLVLVRFGSKLVLVSLVQGEARTISEITDPLEVDQLVGICESNRPGSISQSFRSILTQGAAT